MNKETLSLPVPYTLRMHGNCTFSASWEPAVPTPGLPGSIVTTSRTSGIKAIERLHAALIEKGVINE